MGRAELARLSSGLYRSLMAESGHSSSSTQAQDAQTVVIAVR